jgi:hypothetical protein
MSLKSFAEQVVNEAINTIQDVAGSVGAGVGAAAPTPQDAALRGATIAFEVLFSVVHAASLAPGRVDDEGPEENRLRAIGTMRSSGADDGPVESVLNKLLTGGRGPEESRLGVLNRMRRSGTGPWRHDDDGPVESRLRAPNKMRSGSGEDGPEELVLNKMLTSGRGPEESRLGVLNKLSRRATTPGPGWGDDEGPEERLAEKAAVIGLCVTIAGMLARAAAADMGALLRAALDIKETLSHGPGGKPASRDHRAATQHRLQHVSDRLRILRALGASGGARGSASRAAAFLALLAEAEQQLGMLAPQRTEMGQFLLVDRFRDAMKRSIVTTAPALSGRVGLLVRQSQ